MLATQLSAIALLGVVVHTSTPRVHTRVKPETFTFLTFLYISGVNTPEKAGNWISSHEPLDLLICAFGDAIHIWQQHLEESTYSSQVWVQKRGRRESPRNLFQMQVNIYSMSVFVHFVY